jgi:hypothetical protein
MILAMERSTRSRVVSVECWFFVNNSAITFIMAHTSLLLTYSSSSSPLVVVVKVEGACLFWWHGKWKTENRKQNNWLSISKNKS